MRIEIRKQQTVHELQDAFQQVFPHLKIELYTQAHEHHTGNPQEPVHHQQSLATLLQHEGDIDLQASYLVSEWEQLMRDRFGLHVQVFRRSGKTWLQTIRTDNWTLGQQDAEAAASNQVPPTETEDDYHEQL